MKHITVLMQEAVDALRLTQQSVVVDATFGSGGHANKILSLLGSDGTYIGIDADASAFVEKREKIESYEATTHLVVDNFRNIDSILDVCKVTNVDAILADLGWRTEQFTEGERGFSFHNESPLLMTYGDPATYTFTAHDIVNHWEENNIADIIYGYGEERGSRRIARAIVEARNEAPIETAAALGEIVSKALPRRLRNPRIHPATKTFQALRIAVNDELGALESLLQNGFSRLNKNGRMAIITFHSIEDRMVKQIFKSYCDEGVATRLTKKPITASDQEVKDNPRARSAKLRVLEKTT